MIPWPGVLHLRLRHSRRILRRIIGWDLTSNSHGASTVFPLAGPNHFIELLNIFHVKMPLWLAYDHWTGLGTATKNCRAADGASFRCYAAARHTGVSGQGRRCHRCAVAASLCSRLTPAQCSGDFRNTKSASTFRPSSSRWSSPPSWSLESRKARASTPTIVTIKVGVVLLVIGLGIHYINFSIGHDWSSFAPMGGVSAALRGKPLTSFWPTSALDACPPRRRNARNPQRDLPIASWRRC